MEINNDLLIAEVQKHACLYNSEHDDFKNKEAKGKTWAVVAQGLVGDEQWRQLTEQDMNRFGKEVQKRWKNLRDAFLRALRFQIERGPSKARPYIYQKQMSFLIPVSTPMSCSPYVIKEEPESLIICEPDVEARQLPEDFSEYLDSQHHEPPVIAPAREVSPVSRKRKTRDFDKDVLFIVDKKPTTTEDSDADELFLLSLVPTLKQVPTSMKLDARIKILEALKPFVHPSYGS